MACSVCGGSGQEDTGNNVLPCRHCPAGKAALFGHAQVKNTLTGTEEEYFMGTVTGAEIERHFLNGSPEPIEGTIEEADLPGRNGYVFVKTDRTK